MTFEVKNKIKIFFNGFLCRVLVRSHFFYFKKVVKLDSKLCSEGSRFFFSSKKHNFMEFLGISV